MSESSPETPRSGPEAYKSPEEAARGDIPERYARVVSVLYSRDHDAAVVELETNEPPSVEAYWVTCRRQGAVWIAEGGSNAPPV